MIFANIFNNKTDVKEEAKLYGTTGCRVCKVSGEPKIPPPPPLETDSLLCIHKGEYADLLNFIEGIYGVALSEWQENIIKGLICSYKTETEDDNPKKLYWQGYYSSEHQYKAFDLVSFCGILYYVKKDPLNITYKEYIINIDPTNSYYWEQAKTIK